MWSGPRNLSTALMYSFAARDDCAVWDEPFYAAYLRLTGLGHPMRDEVIAAHDADPASVAAACVADRPEPLVYQKHMTLHMVPDVPRDWMDRVTNVFLIRHPARVVASYAKKREAPTFDDLGFRQQADLFDEVTHRQGHPPPVLSAEAVRSNPEGTLTRLCQTLSIPFSDGMLSWNPGPKPFDGVWAPHWYGAVHASIGFDSAEGPLPDLPPHYARLAEQGMPFYERLLARAL
ncbi:HAD family hydrolase [Rubellimicrobium roseum]|uniref:HAD family hydrolase n=1 Tax=Rubellimicrobium roseum TaxID=687525 RepID=A0A5C4NLW9_9RHOB|nr:HAD family hydrolase [Rubellimicrobium roseum]TNC74388.1 HAD family hydrolase [Rubellimicrobium roseum]